MSFSLAVLAAGMYTGEIGPFGAFTTVNPVTVVSSARETEELSTWFMIILVVSILVY